MNRDKIDSIANQIFGPGDSEEKSRWIEYWQEGRNRYHYYLEQLQKLMLVDFSRSRILDLGCGSGGLDTLLGKRCRFLVGLDYKMHILRLAEKSDSTGYIQGNGIRLPFPDSSFDYIFAFDVLEHLNGGKSWQEDFLKEIRRVTAPQGVVMLSTPNYWYPYDAHSRTSFSQFLPVSIADKRIARKNPEFIKEHQSFRSIRLLRPGKLKKMIRKAGLAPLHSLPCCLDRKDYIRFHPFLGLLSYLGLGWLFHVEFWLILTRKSDRDHMKTRLYKNQHFRKEVEGSVDPLKFEPVIDFGKGSFYHQLGEGWHWPENKEDNFRWIKRRATCYLQSYSRVNRLKLAGYSPIDTRLEIRCDGRTTAIHQVEENSMFNLECPLVFPREDKHIFKIEIRSSKKSDHDTTTDPRELSIQLFSIGVTE